MRGEDSENISVCCICCWRCRCPSCCRCWCCHVTATAILAFKSLPVQPSPLRCCGCCGRRHLVAGAAATVVVTILLARHHHRVTAGKLLASSLCHCRGRHRCCHRRVVAGATVAVTIASLLLLPSPCVGTAATTPASVIIASLLW